MEYVQQEYSGYTRNEPLGQFAVIILSRHRKTSWIRGSRVFTNFKFARQRAAACANSTPPDFIGVVGISPLY